MIRPYRNGYGTIQPDDDDDDEEEDEDEVDLDSVSDMDAWRRTRTCRKCDRLCGTAALVVGFTWALMTMTMSFQYRQTHVPIHHGKIMLHLGPEVDNRSEAQSQSTEPDYHPYHDPSQPLFFAQIVDHNVGPASGTFPQRYYENQNYWRGPGHPIFVIFGGEGPLERILYPFVSEVMAKRFGAITLNPEHR